MNCLKCFLQNRKILYVSSIRNFCNDELQPIEYHGFKYYPRDKNFKDPPYEPSKLFLIRRIKHDSGITKEQKECLKALNIDGKLKKGKHIAIVQNKPETNALLWKIKHLIDIKPIFWKGELPEDGLGSVLRMTGELIISPKLKITEEKMDLSEKFPIENNKLRSSYIKNYLLKKWQTDF